MSRYWWLPRVIAVVLFAKALAGCSGEGSRPRPSEVPTGPVAEAPGGAPAAGTAGSNAGLAPGSGAPEALPPVAPGNVDVGPGEPDPNEPTVGTVDSAGFELAWEDQFDAFDATRWQLMTHSWDSNLAQFSTQNTAVRDGILSLQLTSEPTDAVKPLRGVEMRSIETLTYGKVEARVRLARGSGVVSALVLIYTPWPASDWNELDIEYLGQHSDRVQFNAMVYTGPPLVPPVQQSVTPTQFPELRVLSFDPSADFHVYAMEWTPAEARFTVDGVTEHVWAADIGRLKLPMNILLTIWASSAAAWAGPLDTASIPATADYDWIRVYRWNGAPAPADAE